MPGTKTKPDKKKWNKINAEAAKADSLAKQKAVAADKARFRSGLANKPTATATKCTCPGGGKTDPTCPIHGTGSSL